MLKRSTGLKVALLALTLWPVLYVVVFLMLVMTMAPVAFQALMVIHSMTMLLVLGLMIFYVVHLFKAPIDKHKKIMWLVLLLWGNVIAMPFYFFAYVWPAEPVAA